MTFKNMLIKDAEYMENGGFVIAVNNEEKTVVIENNKGTKIALENETAVEYLEDVNTFWYSKKLNLMKDTIELALARQFVN